MLEWTLVTLPAFAWSSPTRVVFGAGELARLPAAVDEAAAPGARVLLVTGRRSLRESGTLDRVVRTLGPARVTLFDRTPPFPSLATAEAALVACRQARAEAVVAIGGGSALDVGKLVAALATHEDPAADYAEGRRTLGRPGLPVVAVPTTSGSSSEVTPFVALWDMGARRSTHVASPHLLPRTAIVDPELALTMPREVAAATGLDALTSAVESYWSREAEPLSDALALEAIRLLARHLERSCVNGDPDARAACALGATVSGMAYSNSRPNACHAVGSPLTLHFGASHGQAVCVTLPAFLGWVAPAIPEKLPALWHALGVGGLEEATRALAGLVARCGLGTRLSQLGLAGDGDIETLVEHMRWDRVAPLPRPLGRDDARRLLRALL